MMKKRLLETSLFIIYLFVLTCCSFEKKELRLRILANSDNEYDQQIKIEVKNYLKEYLKEKDLLNINIDLLEKDLNNIFDDNITVEVKKVNYEAKSYKGKLVQSGNYNTILITIGSGKGQNFWTLLYPEFFSISFEDDNEVVYKSYLYEKIFNK